jgi:IS30 family transposase
MQQIYAFTEVEQVRGRKRFVSEADQAFLWKRWNEGALFPQIARELKLPTESVSYLIIKRGGITPSERHRSQLALESLEREEISRGIATGKSCRAIARDLGRAPSTISREIERNGGRQSYRAQLADDDTWSRARRPKICYLARNERLRDLVASKLSDDWSPEQISHWLMKSYPDEPLMHVSHETIYRTLYVQTRGALRKELSAHLRRSRGYRKNSKAQRTGLGRGQIADALPISMRPPEADDRAVPGHWEGDLIAGARMSYIVTLVERQSRFVMLLRLKERTAANVANALSRRIRQLPEKLKQSLTWDRGLEMAHHKSFTVATDVKVYFCDPKSPWQRGSNENTNGLLRQYFPKGTDLSGVTQRELDRVALKLNTRPRETLNWETPAEVLAVTVASTS